MKWPTNSQFEDVLESLRNKGFIVSRVELESGSIEYQVKKDEVLLFRSSNVFDILKLDSDSSIEKYYSRVQF